MWLTKNARSLKQKALGLVRGPAMSPRRLAIYGLTTLAILTAPVLCRSQGVISTVAGNGTLGFSGDGGPATSAALSLAFGVGVDSAGNIYISDAGNNRIRKVNTAGVISTFAGNGTMGFSGDGGPATSAALFLPYGVAVDGAGNVYILDTGNSRVRKVDTAGIISTVANDVTGVEALAVDSSGNVYFATNASSILEVNKAGNVSTVAGGGFGFSGDGGPATQAALNFPEGLAVDSAGNIYISDAGNNRIRKVNTAGRISTVAGTGTAGFSGDGEPATSARLGFSIANQQQGLAVDSAGNLYIADVLNNRVRKMNTAGIISTFAGNGTAGVLGNGDGKPATNASVVEPRGVAVDSAGNLFIADTGHGLIRKVTAAPGGASGNPVVFDGGVVNNASFATSPAPVAPGSIAAVFGTNLNDGSMVLFSSFAPDEKLVTTLGGASVTVNNIPAPMFYSTPGQLGIQIPFELATLGAATLQVTVGGQASAPITIALDGLAPGIFTFSQDGNGAAAALHTDGVTPVTPQNPAKTNEVVVLFGTGLGLVSPSLATGAPSTGNTTVVTPTVTVDGNSAEVQFSGAAPGFVGLNQVNIRIPPRARTAANIPVVLSIGPKQSNTVTIAVSQIAK
jgi:uncharacterized protein (TIGR03437 family)